MLQKWSLFDDMYSILGLNAHDAPMDIREDEKRFEVEIDLPGMEPADIDIKVAGDRLTINAQRKWSKPGAQATFRRSFSEAFTLPRLVDSERISATYSSGVLLVVIPKVEGAAARRVEVKVG